MQFRPSCMSIDWTWALCTFISVALSDGDWPAGVAEAVQRLLRLSLPLAEKKGSGPCRDGMVRMVRSRGRSSM